MKASENEFPKVTFAEGAAPDTPDSGLLVAYAKTDGKLYTKNDAGTETELAGGGGSATTLVAARMSKSSSQTFTANTTEQQVTFDREDWDTDGDIVDLDNNRLVVPANGFYLVEFYVPYTSQRVGDNGHIIVKINGADAIPLHRMSAPESSGLQIPTHHVSTVWQLSSGDLLTGWVQPSTEAAQARGAASTHLSTALALTQLIVSA